MKDVGSYMYYFQHNSHTLCVDSTEETGRLDRLVNHSKTNPNCKTKKVVVQNKLIIILEALLQALLLGECCVGRTAAGPKWADGMD